MSAKVSATRGGEPPSVANLFCPAELQERETGPPTDEKSAQTEPLPRMPMTGALGDTEDGGVELSGVKDDASASSPSRATATTTLYPEAEHPYHDVNDIDALLARVNDRDKSSMCVGKLSQFFSFLSWSRFVLEEEALADELADLKHFNVVFFRYQERMDNANPAEQLDMVFRLARAFSSAEGLGAVLLRCFATAVEKHFGAEHRRTPTKAELRQYLERLAERLSTKGVPVSKYEKDEDGYIRTIETDEDGLHFFDPSFGCRRTPTKAELELSRALKESELSLKNLADAKHWPGEEHKGHEIIKAHEDEINRTVGNIVCSQAVGDLGLELNFKLEPGQVVEVRRAPAPTPSSRNAKNAREASWYGASVVRMGDEDSVLIRYSDSEEEELLTREQAEARVRLSSETTKNTHILTIPICSWYIHFMIQSVSSSASNWSWITHISTLCHVCEDMEHLHWSVLGWNACQMIERKFLDARFTVDNRELTRVLFRDFSTLVVPEFGSKLAKLEAVMESQQTAIADAKNRLLAYIVSGILAAINVVGPYILSWLDVVDS